MNGALSAFLALFAVASAEAVDTSRSLTYGPSLLRANSVGEDFIDVPEWLHDIPLENKVSRYRKRRFISLRSTMKVTAVLKLPGRYLIGIPSTVTWTTAFSLRVPSNIQFGRDFLGYNRTHFFDQVENFFEGLDINGRACLLRTICELAEMPFQHGLLGEIVNFLFAITSGPNEIEDDVMTEPNSIYWQAKEIGEHHGDCPTAYSNCPLSILNWVSLLHVSE